MLLYFHCISGAPELWMWGAIASSSTSCNGSTDRHIIVIIIIIIITSNTHIYIFIIQLLINYFCVLSR